VTRLSDELRFHRWAGHATWEEDRRLRRQALRARGAAGEPLRRLDPSPRACRRAGPWPGRGAARTRRRCAPPPASGRTRSADCAGWRRRRPPSASREGQPRLLLGRGRYAIERGLAGFGQVAR
jgi:hypothetical protein